MQYQPEFAPKIEDFADKTAGEVVKAIQGKPDDIEGHRQALHDLNLAICQESCRLAGYPPDELVWAFANDLPNIETFSLYKTRTPLLSLTAAVFLGWLLGGFLATILGFLGMGGEIWRPLAILASLWLEEYLGANPKARRILLVLLGFGALARFAGAIAAGIVRLSGIGGIRQLIFGAARPNILKSLWLWFGAFFLYVFFAKKITGLDIASFRHELAEQISQRLKLMCLVFLELGSRNQTLELLENTENASRQADSAKMSRELAGAAMSILDSLNDGQRRYLAGCLERAGYEVLDSGEDFLVWDEAVHAGKYETIGLVRNGDKCRILERPHKTGGLLAKGLAQRVPA